VSKDLEASDLEAYDRDMFTMANDTELEVRQVLRRMRRLALAFHGSEQRLQDRAATGEFGRQAKVVHAVRTRTSGLEQQKIAAQA